MDSMDHHPQSSVRRGTIFMAENMSDQSHLKTEVVLLQRKYERLAQKERRMQVRKLVDFSKSFQQIWTRIIV